LEKAMQKQDQRAFANNAGTSELFKSMFSFSWAQSLFGLRQLGGLFTPGRCAEGFDQITKATEAELDEPVRNFFRVGDRIQRQTIDVAAGSTSTAPSANVPPATGPNVPGGVPPTRPSPSAPAYPVNSGSLNTSSFVVLGEGLAAGMGDFTLSEETQRGNFAVQMAQQMQTDFPQPYIQAPGICYPIGFTKPPVLVPQPLQSTVLDRIPPVQYRVSRLKSRVNCDPFSRSYAETATS
jgi:hypothetical protein